MNNHPMTTVDDCRLISLERHPHCRGSLTVAQNSDELPFAIRRIFYIYDIPAEAERGGHSHYREQQLIVAASGCFDVKIFDGQRWRTFTLKRPYDALYIPPGLWRTIDSFSSGSIVLTLSSILFDEADYVRDIDDFIKLKTC